MKPISRKNEEKHAVQPLQNEMSSLFKRFTDDPFFSFPNLINSSTDSFLPAMNIEETSDRYRIELEVPGVDPSNVDIELNGNVMVVKGEKTHKQEKTDLFSFIVSAHLVAKRWNLFRDNDFVRTFKKKVLI